MKRLILVCVGIALFVIGYAKAGTWTTLPVNAPPAWGIDGTNIVGGNQIYNIVTGNLTSLNYQEATQTLLYAFQ